MSKTCNIQEKGSNADAKGTQIVSSTRMQKELQGNAMIKFCHVTKVTTPWLCSVFRARNIQDLPSHRLLQCLEATPPATQQIFTESWHV